MEQTQIFGPFLAMMLLTLLVWLFMFSRRIPFITQHLGSTDLSVPGALAAASPASVINPSDNLKNLFEIPVLFYALALYLFATQQVDATYVGAGWVFVAFRLLHSAVHCSFNHVTLRFALYLVAALALWFMLARAVLAHFAG